MVSLVDIAAGDFKIDFMHPHGPKICLIGLDVVIHVVFVKNIIQKIPTPTTTTGITYKINDECYNKTVSAFAKLQQ